MTFRLKKIKHWLKKRRKKYAVIQNRSRDMGVSVQALTDSSKCLRNTETLYKRFCDFDVLCTHIQCIQRLCKCIALERWLMRHLFSFHSAWSRSILYKVRICFDTHEYSSPTPRRVCVSIELNVPLE